VHVAFEVGGSFAILGYECACSASVGVLIENFLPSPQEGGGLHFEEPGVDDGFLLWSVDPKVDL
jgi:hypothetical protein